MRLAAHALHFYVCDACLYCRSKPTGESIPLLEASLRQGQGGLLERAAWGLLLVSTAVPPLLRMGQVVWFFLTDTLASSGECAVMTRAFLSLPAMGDAAFLLGKGDQPQLRVSAQFKALPLTWQGATYSCVRQVFLHGLALLCILSLLPPPPRRMDNTLCGAFLRMGPL